MQRARDPGVRRQGVLVQQLQDQAPALAPRRLQDGGRHGAGLVRGLGRLSGGRGRQAPLPVRPAALPTPGLHSPEEAVDIYRHPGPRGARAH